MRLRPYLYLVRTAFLKLMAYRMRYVTGIATYAIFVGVQYFIWRAVYLARDDATVGGLDLPTLTTYLAVGYMARAAYFNNLDSLIAERFRSGEIVIDLIRPLSFHGNLLAQAAGETGFRLLFFTLPMSLVIVPIFGVHGPVGDGWWLFPLLFVAAFLVNLELNIMAGMATFFLEDITGLMSLKRNLVMIASGLMVPLHFMADLFGQGVVDVLTALPFAIIGYYPILAYVGKLDAGGVRSASDVVLLALCWIVVLRILNSAIWQLARRRLEVQGG